MRRVIFIFSLFGTMAIAPSCNHPVKDDDGRLKKSEYVGDAKDKYANLEYVEDFHDFGTVKQGEIVSYAFTFRNTGNIPLVVKDVIAGCGCTKPTVSAKIVKPNEQAIMEITFNSQGWQGVQYKTITIHSNGIYPKKSVTIKVNVI